MKKFVVCMLVLMVAVCVEAKEDSVVINKPEIKGALPAKKLNKLTRKEKKADFGLNEINCKLW